MTIKLREIVMWIVILLLLGGNVLQFFLCKDCPKLAEKVVESRIDTVYKRGKVKIDTVMIPNPETVEVEKVITNTDTVTKTVERAIDREPVKIYTDTIWVGRPGRGVGLKYYHLIHGDLLDSKYEIDYPQTTVINASRTYVRDYRNQLYVMAGLVTNIEFTDVAIGASYVRDDVNYFYHWTLGRNIHTVGIGYRIFKH